jgi:hypothetical protein
MATLNNLAEICSPMPLLDTTVKYFSILKIFALHHYPSHPSFRMT